MARKPKNMKPEEATLEQGKGVGNMLESAKSEEISVPEVRTEPGAKQPGAIEEVNIDRPEKTKNLEASKLVTASAGATGSGAGLLRGVVFGGGAGTNIGGDVSATTKSDKPYRSGARMGRRFDPITRKIDFNYPELFEVEITRSKPLSETDKKQGYVGNYHNEHVITQRSNGGAPADENFNRSIDMIAFDMNFFADGQYNTTKDSFGEYAAATYDKQTDDYSSVLTIKRGNYLPKQLVVTFNTKGAVGLEFEEDDLANRNIDEATYRLAGDAALRSFNQNELDRLTMVNNAGNESDPKWTMLADAIPTATAVNNILRDVDTLAGDNVFVSKRMLKKAHAWQINKAAKDGLRVRGPMAEMSNGNIEGAYSTAIAPCSESNGISYTFRKEAWAQGGAGLYVALNDSLPKYNTKGKLLTLPLSYRNAIGIADQNDGFLRVHDELYKDICHSDLFSTIDSAYDPMQPVVLTDKINVTNPISLADTGNIEIDANTEEYENELDPIFTYHYENFRNKYNVPVYNYFVKGLHKFFKAYANKFISLLDNAVDGITTLTIPIQSSSTCFSLWDLFVCAATPYMVEARQKSLVDVLKYENDFGYPYTGSTAIKDLDVSAAYNYSFSSIDEPLTTKICDPVDAMKVKLPEVFWTVGCYAHRDIAKDDKYHDFMVGNVVLPHYFNQNQFVKRTDGKIVLGDNASCMSYPSTRSGVRLTDLDTIYGMDEEDYRLSLDRMVVYPGYDRVKASVTASSGVTKVEGQVLASTVASGKIDACQSYKYGFTSDGIPVLPYLATYNLIDDDKADNLKEDGFAKCLTILDVIKTPRELGLHMVMPAGVLTPVRDGSTGLANYRNLKSGYLITSGPGFTAYLWRTDNSSLHTTILQTAQVQMDTAAAFANTWYCIQAMPNNLINDFGAVVSISKGLKATAADHTFTLDGGSFDFVPFVNGAYDAESYDPDTGLYSFGEEQVTDSEKDFSVISFQKYFWTRIQRFPFIINPFDSNASDLSYEASKQKGNKFDIFDLLYYYGFCGFRASDYAELTYERNKNRISLGMNYVNDPYVSKSLLLK